MKRIDKKEVKETVAWVNVVFTCPLCNLEVHIRERMTREKGSQLRSFVIEAFHACSPDANTLWEKAALS